LAKSSSVAIFAVVFLLTLSWCRFDVEFVEQERDSYEVGPQLGRDAKLEVRRNSLGVVVVGVGCAYLIARAMGSNTPASFIKVTCTELNQWTGKVASFIFENIIL
jgi:hypothetical protein